MPIYFYWGEDDFAIAQAVQKLRDRVLDQDWSTFNYEKIPADQGNAVMQALNQAMTPPFGTGGRLVWLVNTTLGQQCSEAVLEELGRTLPAIPENSCLLLTSNNKPDGRLKSTKLLQKYAEIREFALIPPWKADLIAKRVREVTQEIGVKLTAGAADLVAEAVGNQTRQLYQELEKLRLYAGDRTAPLTEAEVRALVTATTQNSLHLAAAIRQGDTSLALELVAELLRQNEPALRVVATLIGQFRTWLWVKLMLDSGERNEQTIAQAAEVSNPKRIYFLQQEVKGLALEQLRSVVPLLLDLEVSLKRGEDELLVLQTRVIEMCQICGGSR
ncbi:MAG: DNA polymerase III subunit delta [Leptolyngbyaceae cyanobacterium bins.59]|nr:DNA polymerase III subunit delta [Leptolyngbyaceae cyanobacterium bins.59]